MLLARVRLRKIGAQLGHFAAQRIERARQLVRNGPEGQERRLKFGATGFDNLEFCGCHDKEESNFCASAVFALPINQLRKDRRAREAPASIICQALRRYLRSFSTKVVRRMRSSRAAPATVPSASSRALRIRPISIADMWSFKSMPPRGSP